MHKQKILFLCISLILLFSVSSENTLAQRFGAGSSIIGWADDNNYLTMENDADGNRVVMSVNVKTGKKKVYDSYRDIRQELRDQLPEGFSLGFGVTVTEGQKTIVLVKDNDLWSFTLGEKDAVRLTDDDIPEVNPALSPEGNMVAYTKNKDLYVFDIEAGKEMRLTFDATDKIYNGYASWVYYEEILGRGSQLSAFWWSPDGNNIAYLKQMTTRYPSLLLTGLTNRTVCMALRK